MHKSPTLFSKSQLLGTSLSALEVDSYSMQSLDIDANYLPFFGQRVSCGLFGISEDYIEKYQSLDSRLIKNKSSTFFFEASSDSMEPLIFEKDILVVDRSIEEVDTKIVVVCYNGEMLCKRLFKQENALILKSENSAYEDIVIKDHSNVIVWGTVVAVAREFL